MAEHRSIRQKQFFVPQDRGTTDPTKRYQAMREINSKRATKKIQERGKNA